METIQLDMSGEGCSGWSERDTAVSLFFLLFTVTFQRVLGALLNSFFHKDFGFVGNGPHGPVFMPVGL